MRCATRIMSVVCCLMLSVMAASAQDQQIQMPDEVFAYSADRPVEGLWVGLLPGDEPPTYIVLDITHDDGGAASVTAMVEVVIATNAKATDIEASDGALAMKITGLAGTFACSVTPDENGHRLTGSYEITRAVGGPVVGDFRLARTVHATDLPDPMAFTGELNVGVKLELRFVFAQTPGGNWVAELDVPMQSVTGLPLVNVKRAGQTITGLLPGQNPATLQAKLSEDEQSFAGVFSQAGMRFDVEFARTEDASAATLNRPQDPEPPYPYDEREIIVEHSDGHALVGTLTLPRSEGPHVTAIMISGSGPQDRDEALLGHRPFLVIADYLTRRGIAVMRFDDRGIGQSTGNFSAATSADFATDVSAVLDHLKTIEAIDGSRIGLIGHSEGGLIAPMVAVDREDVAFAILLAAPGVPGDEILALQVELLMRAGGSNEDEIAAAKAQQAIALEMVREGAEADDIAEAMRPYAAQAIAKMMDVEGDALDQLVDAQIQTVTSPWMRYFMTFDPRETLAKVECPVLALNGTLDLQVWHDQNLPAIEQAMAGRDLTVIRYEGLNHLFQPAETGSVGEYAKIEITIDERVMSDMVEWIKSNVGD